MNIKCCILPELWAVAELIPKARMPLEMNRPHKIIAEATEGPFLLANMRVFARLDRLLRLVSCYYRDSIEANAFWKIWTWSKNYLFLETKEVREGFLASSLKIIREMNYLGQEFTTFYIIRHNSLGNFCVIRAPISPANHESALSQCSRRKFLHFTWIIIHTCFPALFFRECYWIGWLQAGTEKTK